MRIPLSAVVWSGGRHKCHNTCTMGRRRRSERRETNPGSGALVWHVSSHGRVNARGCCCTASHIGHIQVGRHLGWGAMCVLYVLYVTGLLQYMHTFVHRSTTNNCQPGLSPDSLIIMMTLLTVASKSLHTGINFQATRGCFSSCCNVHLACTHYAIQAASTQLDTEDSSD